MPNVRASEGGADADAEGRLTAWLASLGRGTASDARRPAPSLADWVTAAQGRPEWLLWGKAMPSGACPAHPLLCHMLDVAAVAARLLTAVISPALRRRLLALHADELSALRALLFVIAMHDIGKATPAFQAKVLWARDVLEQGGFDLNAPLGARHHSDIGLYFLESVLKERGANPDTALALARSVTAHHGQFPTNRVGLEAPGPRERGGHAEWNVAREAVGATLIGFLRLDDLSSIIAPSHAYVVLLAGLTSVADWIGSIETVFQYEPPQVSLEAYWPLALARADEALKLAGMRPPRSEAASTFGELFPDFAPYPLHRLGDAIADRLDAPSLVISEAPMGEGKTEHALVLAEAAAAHLGQAGFFIGLPTQATANQMFGRVESFLRRTRTHPATLLLAHGEASFVDSFERIIMASIHDDGHGAEGAVRAEQWFLSKKRALLAEYAVGTIDQALLSVMLLRHAFVRTYGLAGKVVILDEVHAYDTYTSTLLDRLIEWLAAAGTTVVLLSATLPSSRRKDLLRAYRAGAGLSEATSADVPYPRITITSRTTHSAIHFEPRSASTRVELESVPDSVERLADRVVAVAQQGACVGWICNTVGRAQEAARHVGSRAPHKLVLHARLLPDERAARETTLERWIGPQARTSERPLGCVVIGTQVLEQSLDVDFDLLVTDVAPVDLVLQRAGRLWRHQRNNRSSACSAPRLVVVSPGGDWSSAKLKPIAAVYDALLLRRTLRELDGKNALTLPDEIEGLVEAVYSRALTESEEALLPEYMNHMGGRAAHRSMAEQKLMPHPFMEDDAFANLHGFLEDDDPSLHKQLRAETRLGPLSIELVCVERRGGTLFVGDREGDDIPLDLSQPPERTLLRRLLRRSIGVSSIRLVQALLAAPETAPTSWAKIAMLRYRHLVAFDAGEATVGDVRLYLDRELGLCIESRKGAS